MATRLKPSRINVDNTPRVGDGAAYQNDNDFHWSMGGGDMSYRDFEWHTLTGTSLVIEEISNNITPSSDFTVSAGTVKPGIEYVLRVNTGNTPYTMTLGTGVTNPNGYSTELTPNKVNQFKFIATSDSQLELEGVDTSEYLTGLTILSYGNSTWNDFITAYQKNSIVYCRASSESNPATGSQNRLAFMAYVNNATSPTEVEFQYYRSRSSHGSDANQQDEVYVYKLTSAGTWTVTVRDTAAKIATGTGLTKAYTTSGSTSTLTIANDGVLTVNGANGTVTVNDIKQSATAPSSPTEGTVWYDTTNDVLKSYDGTNWNEVGDAEDINVKMFKHVGSNGFSNAEMQEAVDYIITSGKLPILVRDVPNTDYIALLPTEWIRDGNNKYIKWESAGTNSYEIGLMIRGCHNLTKFTIQANLDSSNQVTSVSHNSKTIGKYLDADYNYSTPYTPLYNGSPTTKKYVDDRDTYIGSSEPTSNKVEGRLWYDTTNDQLKVYDGTNWNVTGKEYNAGPGIEIGTYNDYSAMQGPCPDGFHVPSDTEWTAVKTVWTTLGGGSSDGTNFGIALKLPFAGKRRGSSASVASQGTDGSYWSSIGDTTAKLVSISSSSINTSNSTSKGNCNSIRPFKDTPVTPTSSWTKLYGTSIESGGIFWNSTDGLISLSSDGSNWLTIADKNLEATTVWNSGDTLSEANCGKYYQRGNNYGFPRTGSVTTSSTQVDATNYGPGNYYSSSTFITGYGDRSSVNNDNLWGGVTGVVTIQNAISNTGVFSVNGQTGDVTVEESNTKTFYLSTTSDLTTAQAAYDWYVSGKNPIVVMGDLRYNVISKSPSSVLFVNNNTGMLNGSNTSLRHNIVTFVINNGTVQGVTSETANDYVLATDQNYPTPYVPLYDGSPATKKYVDDHAGITNNTTGTTTTVSKIRAGTESEYAALSSYDTGTIYYLY